MDSIITGSRISVEYIGIGIQVINICGGTLIDSGRYIFGLGAVAFV